MINIVKKLLLSFLLFLLFSFLYKNGFLNWNCFCVGWEATTIGTQIWLKSLPGGSNYEGGDPPKKPNSNLNLLKGHYLDFEQNIYIQLFQEYLFNLRKNCTNQDFHFLLNILQATISINKNSINFEKTIEIFLQLLNSSEKKFWFEIK